MKDLRTHGSASRCLLRLRENLGRPYLSDDDFIARYQSRFPGWQQRPGALSAEGLRDLAAELGVGGEVEWTRDYDRIMEEHAAGRSVLVLTEHAPLPGGIGRKPWPTTSLLLAMTQAGFTLWWPSPTGPGEELPFTDRIWWTRWLARGAMLRPRVAGLLAAAAGGFPGAR